MKIENGAQAESRLPSSRPVSQREAIDPEVGRRREKVRQLDPNSSVGEAASIMGV